jgi:hypothetical protein
MAVSSGGDVDGDAGDVSTFLRHPFNRLPRMLQSPCRKLLSPTTLGRQEILMKRITRTLITATAVSFGGLLLGTGAAASAHADPFAIGPQIDILVPGPAPVQGHISLNPLPPVVLIPPPLPPGVYGPVAVGSPA